MVWISALFFLIMFWFFSLIAGSGWREHHPRAVVFGVVGMIVVLLAAWAMFGAGHHPAFQVLQIIITVLLIAGAVLSLSSWGKLPDVPDLSQAQLFDERNHMFARANLVHHPALFRKHHEAHPEHLPTDRRLAELPELGEPGSTYFDPVYSPIADAAFTMLARSYPSLSERSRGTGTPPEPDELATAIRFLATRYGAADIGFIRTRAHHWYSHAGRQAHNWGEPIATDHPFAVVIVVAMDPNLIRFAPTLPAIHESSRGYVEAAKLAHLVAEYLSAFGYDATAHVDGNYQVICAPMAQEAGLGHVGRMGIFMHRRFGPCVRLSVVTTNAELPETNGDHRYMEAFCRICLKCADNCPTRSISFEDRPAQSRGFLHWSVDQERCYTFWRKIGTDCAVCIRSCPFTKPDTLLHRLARWYIRRNPVNRWIALKMDDLIYGRRLRIASRNPDFRRL